MKKVYTILNFIIDSYYKLTCYVENSMDLHSFQDFILFVVYTS